MIHNPTSKKFSSGPPADKSLQKVQRPLPHVKGTFFLDANFKGSIDGNIFVDTVGVCDLLLVW